MIATFIFNVFYLSSLIILANIAPARTVSTVKEKKPPPPGESYARHYRFLRSPYRPFPFPCDLRTSRLFCFVFFPSVTRTSPEARGGIAAVIRFTLAALALVLPIGSRRKRARGIKKRAWKRDEKHTTIGRYVTRVDVDICWNDPPNEYGTFSTVKINSQTRYHYKTQELCDTCVRIFFWNLPSPSYLPLRLGSVHLQQFIQRSIEKIRTNSYTDKSIFWEHCHSNNLDSHFIRCT